jgi:hypothetical protein
VISDSFEPHKALLHPQCGRTPHGERGVFIVIGALWISVFLMLTALAIDTFMLATAKLQQGNTVDYLALSALHALKDPPAGAVPPSGQGYDTVTYNFVIDKAAVVAAASLLGSGGAQASASDLRIRISSGRDDEGEGCGTDDDYGGSGPTGGGSGGPDGGNSNCSGVENTGNCKSGGKDRWCGFEGVSDVGSVIFGQYDPASGSFTPAPFGSVGSVNAVRVRLQLQDPSSSPLVLPMMKLVLASGHIMFESKATAYRDGSGRYMLVNSGS